MATATYTTDDPYAAAMNPVERQQERTYFGLVAIIDPWFCVLQKGVGKRPFDASQDDINQRSTAIKLSVEVEKRDGTTYTVDQDTLDWSKEWREFTLPSLRQLGITDLRTLKNTYVQIKRENTGEKYVNKSGEEKDKSAIVFIATYPSMEAMKIAADVFYTPRNGATPATPAAPVDDGEYAFAVQTLAMLWKAVKEDEDKFLQAITNNPMLVKYFTAESPEVRKFTLPF